MEQIQYKRAQTTNELYQILELQRTNIPSAISLEERNNEGFVTVHHTYDILKAMNDKCPHVIATHNENTSMHMEYQGVGNRTRRLPDSDSCGCFTSRYGVTIKCTCLEWSEKKRRVHHPR